MTVALFALGGVALALVLEFLELTRQRDAAALHAKLDLDEALEALHRSEVKRSACKNTLFALAYGVRPPGRRTEGERDAYLDGYEHGLRVMEGKLKIYPDDPARGLAEARKLVAFLRGTSLS